MTTQLQQELTSPRAAVVCRHVCLGYNGEQVLRDVNLDIPRGAFLPFVGPNGGGKTTLLRGILGLITPECGTISLAPSTARLGYVPQQKTIDPLFPMTLEDIVLMVFYRNGGWRFRPTREQRVQAREALAALGLAGDVYKNYRELSGGMKQKALIARALLAGADILVLDEPTSELDAPSEREISEHLLELNQTRGKTILMACHGKQPAIACVDRVCLVEHGQALIVDADTARQFTAYEGVATGTAPHG